MEIGMVNLTYNAIFAGRCHSNTINKIHYVFSYDMTKCPRINLFSQHWDFFRKLHPKDLKIINAIMNTRIKVLMKNPFASINIISTVKKTTMSLEIDIC